MTVSVQRLSARSSTRRIGPATSRIAAAREESTEKALSTPANRYALLPPGSPVGPPTGRSQTASYGVDELRMPARGHRDDSHGVLGPVPVAEHASTRGDQRGGGRGIRSSGSEQCAQGVAPAEVGEAGEGAALPDVPSSRPERIHSYREAISACR